MPQGAARDTTPIEGAMHLVQQVLVRPAYMVLLHVVLVVRFVVMQCYNFAMWPVRPILPPNTALIAAHLAQRDALIAEAKDSVPTHTELVKDGKSSVHAAIVGSSICDIVRGIEERQWTATTVANVFIRSAIDAHERTNCLTEVNFVAALKRASQLDAAFAKTGKVVGPLHGVPFSLKDQYSLKGKLSTIGFSEWLKKQPEERDCAFAEIVQSLGAVCIAKTNVPQTMFSFECRNPLWGQTSNPYNQVFTSGGSSGGEAALLASGGAAFGYGSDIGGSLRIPSGFCGTYALKPSNGRSWPRAGNVDLGPRPRAVESVAGPMCRTMEDLELLMRLVFEALYPDQDSVQSPRDLQKRFGVEIMPSQPVRPQWFDPLTAASSKELKGANLGRKLPLRIGYYRCDGLTLTSPACMRAVDEAVQALSKVQDPTNRSSPAIELVEINPAALQTFRVFKSFAALNSINRQIHLLAHVGQDPLDVTLALSMRSAQSRLVRIVISLVAKFYYKDDLLPQVMRGLSGDYAQKYFEHETIQDTVRREFERNVWDGYNLDAIICPVQAGPAMPNYGTALLPTLAASTILYNVLANPVVVVPVTRVDAELDRHEAPSSSKDGMARQAQHAAWTMMRGRETCSPMVTANFYKKYDAVRMAGLPVGVQVVTREYDDEKAIGVAHVLDDALMAASPSHRQTFGPGAHLTRTMPL